MGNNSLYSIRMRASKGNRHISGAERIVSGETMEVTVQSLIARARKKKCAPDQIVIHIEDLGNARLQTLTALDVLTVDTPEVTTGRLTAVRILQSLGVSNDASLSALRHLSGGTGPEGSNMRGAIIMDAQNGRRLEPDQARGVRASRFDWTESALDELTVKLKAIGLTHYRTREALALATKVAHAPGMVAELCWSDDPDYTAGYVASRTIGYVRLPMLKSHNDPNGGRVFFVNRINLDIDAFIHYLQKETILISKTGKCMPAIRPEDYFCERNQSSYKTIK